MAGLIQSPVREAAELSNSPSPDFHAAPASDSDLFDWHFTLRGPPASSFADGHYHGRIVLPPTYPLRPPMFRFLTPSGRFEVNREICLSISGHHEETWSPSWGIRTALTALRSFMETDAKGQLGGLECSKEERARLAGSSKAWKCTVCQKSNKEILDESSEAARVKAEAEGDMGGSGPKEEEVPKELKIAYTDQKKGPGDSSTANGESKNEEDNDAQLAEGFVETGNAVGSSNASPTTNSTSISTPYPPARPVQTVPQPTSSPPAHPVAQARVTAAPAYPPQRQMQVRSNEGVPVWLDRTIAAVVICLVAMVFKVLFGV
jgi:ubiquitin-conjugating enzyme E2 J1